MTDPDSVDEKGLPAAILEATAIGQAVMSTRRIPEAEREAVTDEQVDERDALGTTAAILSNARGGDRAARSGGRGRVKASKLYSWKAGRARPLSHLLYGATPFERGPEREPISMDAKRRRRLLGFFRKERLCPLCGWRGYRFEPFGNPSAYREDAQCPICGSLERHRAARLLLKDVIKPGQKVLHVAPEEIMIAWLVMRSKEYENFDLYNPAMRKMDITKLDVPDRSKTLIWCSHVLEHIRDEFEALSELYRVLEPGGQLILQVPVGGDLTYEDDTVTSEQDRLEKFLQEDHVRLYGRDLRERIASAGFECEMLTTADLTLADQRLYGVGHPVYRDVFVARRPAHS